MQTLAHAKLRLASATCSAYGSLAAACRYQDAEAEAAIHEIARKLSNWSIALLANPELYDLAKIVAQADADSKLASKLAQESWKRAIAAQEAHFG